MGRLVHCQETCSHVEDFKESVATVFRHAIWRGYPNQMEAKVRSRFLFQRWYSTDIRVKELRVFGYPRSGRSFSRPKAVPHPSPENQRHHCRVQLEGVAF